MSRYEGLTDHLRSRTEPIVELTFMELDRLVVGRLPASARKHATWWPNTRGGQPHSGAWLDAHRHATPDFIKGTVRFELAAGSAAVSWATPPARGADQTQGLSLEVDWDDAGPIKLNRGRITLPTVPAEPGLFRLNLLASVGSPVHFIGESADLARRIQQLSRPGVRQKTNQRVNEVMKSVLRKAGSIDLSVSVVCRLDGRPLDLRGTPARRLAENATIVLLARAEVPVENI